MIPQRTRSNGEWRKNDEGVSPVIATILMVAVTVVLAAVVSAYVGGFNITPSPPPDWFTVSPGSSAGTIKFMYTAGPANLESINLTIDGGPSPSVQLGSSPVNGWSATMGHTTGAWNVGDFVVYTKGASAGQHQVVLVAQGVVVLSASVAVT